MELIERYLQAIGRALPPAQRADILSELRSSLYDALESEEGAPDEAWIVALIKEMGPPEKVAAAYYPAGQYLIGPSLYPTFRTVLGIVCTVVVAIQIFGLGFAVISDTSPGVLFDSSWDFVASLAAAFGSVVLIFWALQRFEVQPEPTETFNPRDLPPLEPDGQAISRGSHVFSIIVNVVVLVFLMRFAQRGGFTWIDGRSIFENPVISQFLPLIILSSLAEIVFEIVVLWQGRLQQMTRIAKVLVNLFSLGVVIVLLHGHNTWLAARGVVGQLAGIADIPALIIARDPLVGMIMFRAGIVVALLIVGAETISSIYKLIRAQSVRSKPVIANSMASR